MNAEKPISPIFRNFEIRTTFLDSTPSPMNTCFTSREAKGGKVSEMTSAYGIPFKLNSILSVALFLH